MNTLKSDGLSAIVGVKCHVSSAEDRTRLFQGALDRFGGIDILVSNAAVNPSYEHVLECTEEKWDKIFDVNVKSSWLLAKEVLPHIRKQGTGGSIVFMGSIGAFQAETNIGAYCASKTALLGLTKAASIDLAAEGIRVNGFCPGPTDTNFGRIMFNTEEKLDKLLKAMPMKRLARPEEMGGVVAFLVSDDASYITGETIIISGGFVSRL